MQIGLKIMTTYYTAITCAISHYLPSKLGALLFFSLSVFACSQQNPAITAAASSSQILREDETQDKEIGNGKNSDESAVVPEPSLTPSATAPSAAIPTASPTPTSDLPADNEVLPATKPALLADKLALVATPIPGVSEETHAAAFECKKPADVDECRTAICDYFGACIGGCSFPNCNFYTRNSKFPIQFGEPPAAGFNEPQSVLFELLVSEECSTSKPRDNCSGIPIWQCRHEFGPTLEIAETKNIGQTESSPLTSLLWDGNQPQTPSQSLSPTIIGRVVAHHEYRFTYGPDTIAFGTYFSQKQKGFFGPAGCKGTIVARKPKLILNTEESKNSSNSGIYSQIKQVATTIRTALLAESLTEQKQVLQSTSTLAILRTLCFMEEALKSKTKTVLEWQTGASAPSERTITAPALITPDDLSFQETRARLLGEYRSSSGTEFTPKACAKTLVSKKLECRDLGLSPEVCSQSIKEQGAAIAAVESSKVFLADSLVYLFRFCSSARDILDRAHTALISALSETPDEQCVAVNAKLSPTTSEARAKQSLIVPAGKTYYVTRIAGGWTASNKLCPIWVQASGHLDKSDPCSLWKESAEYKQKSPTIAKDSQSRYGALAGIFGILQGTIVNITAGFPGVNLVDNRYSIKNNSDTEKILVLFMNDSESNAQYNDNEGTLKVCGVLR